jgi:hypothetical protein
LGRFDYRVQESQSPPSVRKSNCACTAYNWNMRQAVELVSVDEYLRTSYEGPDREYVDGVIMERNSGELPHTLTQLVLMEFFLPSARRANCTSIRNSGYR